MKYRIQQKASIWVEVKVEADSLEEAMKLAEKDIDNGDFWEDPASFELEDEFWWEDEDKESGRL